jgi:hypothetical protein
MGVAVNHDTSSQIAKQTAMAIILLRPQRDKFAGKGDIVEAEALTRTIETLEAILPALRAAESGKAESLRLVREMMASDKTENNERTRFLSIGLERERIRQNMPHVMRAFGIADDKKIEATVKDSIKKMSRGYTTTTKSVEGYNMFLGGMSRPEIADRQDGPIKMDPLNPACESRKEELDAQVKLEKLESRKEKIRQRERRLEETYPFLRSVKKKYRPEFEKYRPKK